MKLIQIIKIKYFYKKNKWKNCVRFFKYDFRNVKTKTKFRIFDCKTKFYSYQIFEIFVMLKMKIFQNEKYNVDDMKLKKICDKWTFNINNYWR